MKLFVSTLSVVLLLSTTSISAQEPLRIVSWNTKATLMESLPERREQFTKLNEDLKPDVLIMIEVAGRPEAGFIAESLGWENYHAVMSDFGKVRDGAYSGLELVVVSKVAIEHVVEFDTDEDGSQTAFGAGELAGTLPPVIEEVISNTALPSLGSFDHLDRGTLRVDLANGMTIFPVHFKSNRNTRCDEIDKARSAIRTQDAELADKLKSYYENGFRKATEQHLRNARLRERMMAAVLVEANRAVEEGRTVLIAGDFNIAFEPGKSGSQHDDCVLQDFSCRQAPFPKSACRGDGFDDTLAIAELPLVGSRPWEFLSRTLTRTYKSNRFADLAIDHMVVPKEQSSMFATAKKSEDAYGSDHFAVITEFTQN